VGAVWLLIIAIDSSQIIMQYSLSSLTPQTRGSIHRAFALIRQEPRSSLKSKNGSAWRTARISFSFTGWREPGNRRSSTPSLPIVICGKNLAALSASNVTTMSEPRSICLVLLPGGSLASTRITSSNCTRPSRLMLVCVLQVRPSHRTRYNWLAFLM
jgi:hypothetical protein